MKLMVPVVFLPVSAIKLEVDATDVSFVNAFDVLDNDS